MAVPTLPVPLASRERRPYPSDLRDEEWALIEPLVPEAIWFPNLTMPKHTRREIVNAILYVIRTGCQWRALPHDFAPWQTAFKYFTRWRKTGVERSGCRRSYSGIRRRLRYTVRCGHNSVRYLILTRRSVPPAAFRWAVSRDTRISRLKAFFSIGAVGGSSRSVISR